MRKPPPMTSPATKRPMKPESARQVDECLEVARSAQLAGDTVTFIAAVHLAAQLVQLAKIQATLSTPSQETERE